MKKTKKIKIILNGKPRSLQKTTSLHDLMRSLKLPIDKVAIELNKEIINKKLIKNLYLKNKDKIEIVHFIGGG
ncbi:sulfur carrier protein ThiS [Candidatus Pelagibacter sp.]|nr:sulfur carrier protein ThiS [Candidatus Pelagibacter sp.]